QGQASSGPPVGERSLLDSAEIAQDPLFLEQQRTFGGVDIRLGDNSNPNFRETERHKQQHEQSARLPDGVTEIRLDSGVLRRCL
ncbi:unnamed protein product, partial [Amoebophrya sp. A25]